MNELKKGCYIKLEKKVDVILGLYHKSIIKPNKFLIGFANDICAGYSLIIRDSTIYHGDIKIDIISLPNGSYNVNVVLGGISSNKICSLWVKNRVEIHSIFCFW